MMNPSIKLSRQPRLNLSFLWIGLLQLFAVTGSWAVASGGNILRMFAIGSTALALALPLLAGLEAGLMAMMIFEPFRGFLRRAQYLIVPYSQNEPIHLITPAVAFIALLLVLSRHKLEIFRATPLALPVTILAGICFLQIFNPLQGGFYVGLTGAMFYLVPMAWFYFGQHVKADFFPQAMRLVVFLGIIASLHGVYQITFGYPDFERHWIENTDLYNSIAVYNVTRALATFSNAEEWGRYVLLGALAAFGFALMRSKGGGRVLWLAAALILCGMMALSGQRSSIFGLMLGLLVLFVTGAKTFGNAAARILLMAAPVVLVLALSSTLNEDDIYELDNEQGVKTMLSHTTKGTVNPTGEGSLSARFLTWNRLVTEDLPRNPIGSGLGSTTLAASRTRTHDSTAIDNHFLSFAVSAGVPAVLLLFWILFRAAVLSFRRLRELSSDSDDFAHWRIAAALLSSFILNNFFGTSFVIYSVAPIGWLLLGWISAQAERVESIEND